MDELEIIEWVRARSRTHSSIRVGIGDDMAIVDAGAGCFLVSTDLLLDQVHFDSKIHSPTQIGRKAVARSLSDCAAMAVRPVSVLISVALPRSMPDPAIRELFQAMCNTAAQFGAVIAGGDTARWNSPLAIDVAVTGEPYLGIEPVPRKGAKLGDVVYSTGRLGGSILGRHLTFLPRIDEARTIATKLGGKLHAMIDISDGLTLDLWRLCQESGVGALLDESLILEAVSDDARTLARTDGISDLQHALSDGEDYELLMAVDPSATISGLPVLPLGRIVQSGLSMTRVHGVVEALVPRGFVH